MSPNDRRALIILGSVLGVAILVWFIFLRGGGDDVAEVSPSPAGVTSTVPAEATTTAPPPVATGGGGPVLSGRDPFSPLPLPSVSPSPSIVVVSPSP